MIDYWWENNTRHNNDIKISAHVQTKILYKTYILDFSYL